MIEAAYEARVAGDALVASATEPVPGGVEFRTPELPDSFDYNAVVLAPGADGPALRSAAARLRGRRLIAFAPTEIVDLEGFRREEELVLAYTGSPPARPAGVVQVSGPALRDARRGVWRSFARTEYDQLLDVQDRQAAAGTLLASFEDGVPVAWAGVLGGFVDDVWVQPHARRRGLGRTLTTAAMSAGGRFLSCDPFDPVPQRLYRSLGWVEIGRSSLWLRDG